MTAYETLEYMLKGTDLISRISTETFEIRLRDLYNRCGSISDDVLKRIIDDNVPEDELFNLMDKYEHLDTVIDEFAYIMDDLKNI